MGLPLKPGRALEHPRAACCSSWAGRCAWGPTLAAVLTLSATTGAAGRGPLPAFGYVMGAGLPFPGRRARAQPVHAPVRPPPRQMLIAVGVLEIGGVWADLMAQIQAWVGDYQLATIDRSDPLFRRRVLAPGGGTAARMRILTTAADITLDSRILVPCLGTAAHSPVLCDWYEGPLNACARGRSLKACSASNRHEVDQSRWSSIRSWRISACCVASMVLARCSA
jgi:hypothetical protein